MIRFHICLIACISLLAFSFQSGAQVSNIKTQPVFKTARLFNGVAIENIKPTADYKGVVVTTADNKTYFLNRGEAKQKLDIQLSDDEYTLPKDIGVVFYDKNGVPSDNYRNYDYPPINSKALPYESIRIFIENSKANTKLPLYILNGKEISKTEMEQINPSTIERVDVLKGDAAALAYGERGREGVIVITLKTLYIINGKESTKEEMTRLDSASVEKVNVVSRDSAVSMYGEEGKGGAVIITLKATTTDTVRATFPGGITTWRRYIERALKYPRTAQNNKTQGVIRVLTTISETGKVTFAKALNNPGDGLAEEAERVIKESPTWVPATLDGKPIPVSFVQKITFRLG